MDRLRQVVCAALLMLCAGTAVAEERGPVTNLPLPRFVSLKAGGEFVSINENPEQSFAQHAGYTQYGFNKSSRFPQADGAAMTYSMISGRSMISFDVYYFFFHRALHGRLRPIHELHHAPRLNTPWTALSLSPLL